jgi:hypothetical protein
VSGWIGARLRRLREGLGRLGNALWWDRSLAFRRRAAAVLLVLGVYALVRFVPLPGVPCEVSPAEECPAVDDAIELVPADAYAYAHVNLDRDSNQFEQAEELAAEFPHFAAIAQGSFRALGPGRRLDLGIDVFPWLGDEVAAAELAGRGGRPERLLLMAVGERAGARAFLAKVGGRSERETEHRGIELVIYRRGLASAEQGRFLLLGAPAAVRAAIDASTAETEALAASEEAASLRDELPDHRLADLYVSEDGIDRLLANRGGLAAQLDTFTDFGASEGVVAALVAHDDGLELELRSALDPEAARASPGFFSAFPTFRPSLAAEFEARTLALLSVGDPSQTVRQLLEQADAAVPGIAEAFDRLNSDLARDGGVDIEEDLLPALGGEAAIGVAPGRAVPFVTAVFADVDEEKARDAVARLQAPLIAALDPARTGQAPTFSRRRVEEVELRSVRLGPALELAYAIFDGRLVVSTNPRGVEAAIAGGEDLAGTDTYRAATAGNPDEVSALVFLNLDGLVELAEPRGLAEIVSDFSQDLARLRALSVTVRSRPDSIVTRAFLNIAEPEEGGG